MSTTATSFVLPNNAINYELHNLIFVLLLCVFFVWAGKLCRGAFMLTDLRIGRKKRKLLWFGDQAPQYSPNDIEFFSKRQIEHLVRFKAHSDTPMVRLPTVAVPFSISRSSVAVQNTAGKQDLILTVNGTKPCTIHVLFRVQSADLHDFLAGCNPVGSSPRPTMVSVSPDSSIASDWPWQNMPVPKAEVATKPESKKRSSGNISTVKKRLNSVLGQQPIEPPRTLKGRHDSIELQEVRSNENTNLLQSLLELEHAQRVSLAHGSGNVTIPMSDQLQATFFNNDALANFIPVVIIAGHDTSSDEHQVAQRVQLLLASVDIAVAPTTAKVRFQVEQELWVAKKDGTVTVEDIFGLDTLRGDEPECVVCLTDLKTITILPCKHLCVCSACGKQLDKCPVCRGPLLAHMQFMADSPVVEAVEPQTLEKATMQWLKESSEPNA